MPSISTDTYKRMVRAGPIYDVVVAAPFATPWTFAWNWNQLSGANKLMGGTSLPAFDVFPVLIACLLGSIVLVWSALRIATPEIRFGRFDGAARFLFSTWMAWAMYVTGAPLLWLFRIPEFAWSVAQWWRVKPIPPKG